MKGESSMKKRKKNEMKYESVPVILTFIVLFIIFGVALANMTEKDKADYTMEKVSAFDLTSRGEYSFVEVEGGNGKKNYVVTRNITETTSALSGREDASSEEATLPAVATTVTTTRKKTTTTTTTEATETTTTTAAENNENSKRRIAYLTFDDGPSENTRKILDILDKYNVKATFFVIYHKGMESEYKEIIADIPSRCTAIPTATARFTRARMRFLTICSRFTTMCSR